MYRSSPKGFVRAPASPQQLGRRFGYRASAIPWISLRTPACPCIFEGRPQARQDVESRGRNAWHRCEQVALQAFFPAACASKRALAGISCGFWRGQVPQPLATQGGKHLRLTLRAWPEAFFLADYSSREALASIPHSFGAGELAHPWQNATNSFAMRPPCCSGGGPTACQEFAPEGATWSEKLINTNVCGFLHSGARVSVSPQQGRTNPHDLRNLRTEMGRSRAARVRKSA